MQKSNPKASPVKTTPRVQAPAPVVTPQQKAFENAMEAFHARDFGKAKKLFEEVLQGPNKELLFTAKQHLSMCEQRLRKGPLELESAEDHYNYAVSLMNRRDLDGAQAHLEKALKSDDADHIHYLLALVLGLRRDIAGAAKHLRRAIEIHPKNRVAAHNDADFAELMQHAEIKELIQVS